LKRRELGDAARKLRHLRNDGGAPIEDEGQSHTSRNEKYWKAESQSKHRRDRRREDSRERRHRRHAKEDREERSPYRAHRRSRNHRHDYESDDEYSGHERYRESRKRDVDSYNRDSDSKGRSLDIYEQGDRAHRKQHRSRERSSHRHKRHKHRRHRSRSSSSEESRRSRSPRRERYSHRRRYDSISPHYDKKRVDSANPKPAKRHSQPHKSTHSSNEASPNRSRNNTDNDSDPLEAILGPPLPPKTPPVRIRGRGATAFTSGIDARFSKSYDPTWDVQPDENEDDDWDVALEALRDRQRWQKQGAERLRAAGFSQEEVGKWEVGISEAGAKTEKGEDDVVWKKRGEAREWDRGKTVDQLGVVRIESEYGRLKGT
jgi:hypothetical protein